MGSTASRAVSHDKCGACDCWLCYCEAQWDAAAGETIADAEFTCRRDCEISMISALSTLAFFLVLLVAMLAAKRPYSAFWSASMVLATTLVTVLLQGDVPSVGEQDLYFNCTFPSALILYGTLLAVIGAFSGLTVLSIWKGRKDKKEREDSRRLGSDLMATP